MVIVIYISYLINENRMMWRRRAHVCHEYHELYSWRKNCHVEKFGLSIKNLNNLWSSIKVYAVFVPNLYGEKSAWRKSVWNKNDNYEVCSEPQCTGSITRSWHPLYLEIFFGRFLLGLIKPSQVMFTVKIGPTALNFG